MDQKRRLRMSGSPRDLAVLEPGNASLHRLGARRAHTGHGRVPRRADPDSRRPSSLLDVGSRLGEPRDLAEHEPWQLSLGRSRARRRAAELRFVPAGSRAKRASLGALAVLAGGPSAGLAAGRGPDRPLAPGPEPPTTGERTPVLSAGGEGGAGSEGKQVEQLQRALGGIKVDGIFGPETEEAVRQFQAGRGLAADGVVGPVTGASLESHAT